MVYFREVVQKYLRNKILLDSAGHQETSFYCMAREVRLLSGIRKTSLPISCIYPSSDALKEVCELQICTEHAVQGFRILPVQ